MKTVFKRLWFGAGHIMTMAMSIVSVVFFSSYRISRQIKRLSKEVGGHSVCVLGNGPSLKEVLSTPKLRAELQLHHLIVTNRFALSNDFMKLRPQYYILLDPLFFDELYIQEDTSIKDMYRVLNDVDWPMILFLSREANFHTVKKYLTNPNIKIQLYNATTILGFTGFQNMMYHHNLGLPSSRNVIIPAIMMMMNLGYQNIYIYGAEFSWTKNFDVDPRNNRVFLNNGHFYNIEEVKYFPKGEYRLYLKHVCEMLYGTELLAKYAENLNVKVINRTKGSFIDAFEYENPELL